MYFVFALRSVSSAIDVFRGLISLAIVEENVLVSAGQGNTIVSHFVVQRADLILRPAPFSYLCERVRVLGVLKIVCCCTINPDCRMPAVVSIFTGSAACVLSFYAPPLHYNNNNNR